MDDREFDEFLRARHAPDAPSNLAARIIDEAARVERDAKSKISFGERLRRFVDGFAIPRSAYALGLFLMLAVGLGVLGTDVVNISVSPEQQQGQDVGDVSLAFYVDDLLGADDFL